MWRSCNYTANVLNIIEIAKDMKIIDKKTQIPELIHDIADCRWAYYNFTISKLKKRIFDHLTHGI